MVRRKRDNDPFECSMGFQILPHLRMDSTPPRTIPTPSMTDPLRTATGMLIDSNKTTQYISGFHICLRTALEDTEPVFYYWQAA